MLATGLIFCPCGDTSQTGPIFSVISMRPSGRKASRQGSSKVVTVVMVKGRLASGFCSPTLTWAQTAADARVKSTTVFAKRIVISPYLALLLELPCVPDARCYFPPRLLIPCASIWTLKTVPPPTIYSVFISGPAKARFCGLLDGVMEPKYAPCGVKT